MDEEGGGVVEWQRVLNLSIEPIARPQTASQAVRR